MPNFLYDLPILKNGRLQNWACLLIPKEYN